MCLLSTRSEFESQTLHTRLSNNNTTEKIKMTLEKLKELYLTARKNNAVTDKNILQCLIADIELENSRGKNCDPITMINKFIKNAKANLELTTDQKFSIELDLLNDLLPTKMTENEMLEEIALSSNMKEAIQHFKQKHNGKYDPAELAKQCKIYFASK